MDQSNQQERIERQVRMLAAQDDLPKPTHRAEYQTPVIFRMALALAVFGYCFALYLATQGWRDAMPGAWTVSLPLCIIAVAIAGLTAWSAGSRGGFKHIIPGMNPVPFKVVSLIAVAGLTMGVAFYFFTILKEGFAEREEQMIRLEQLQAERRSVQKQRDELWTEISRVGDNYITAKLEKKKAIIDPLDGKISALSAEIQSAEMRLATAKESEDGALTGIAGIAGRLQWKPSVVAGVIALGLALLVDPALFVWTYLFSLAVCRDKARFLAMRDRDEMMYPRNVTPIAHQPNVLDVMEGGSTLMLPSGKPKKRRWFRRK